MLKNFGNLCLIHVYSLWLGMRSLAKFRACPVMTPLKSDLLVSFGLEMRRLSFDGVLEAEIEAVGSAMLHQSVDFTRA